MSVYKKDNTPLPFNEQLKQKMIHPCTFKELHNLSNKQLAKLLEVPTVTVTGWSRLPESQTPASPLMMRCLYYIHISREQSHVINRCNSILKNILSFLTNA